MSSYQIDFCKIQGWKKGVNGLEMSLIRSFIRAQCFPEDRGNKGRVEMGTAALNGTHKHKDGISAAAAALICLKCLKGKGEMSTLYLYA